MKFVDLKLPKRLNLSAFALALAGIVANSAHADTPKDAGAAPQCTNVDAMMVQAKYPAGTTFKLTKAGLLVLSKPRETTSSEPEWPNYGN